MYGLKIKFGKFLEIIGSQLSLVVGSVTVYVGILAILPILLEDHSKKKN